jgi:quercetin dioxygenase-like cupin family protein
MSLFVSEADLVPGQAMVGLHGGQMKTLFVYGNEANLMIATRFAGYHSKPHRHTPEQLNYVIEGELWIFIEEDGYHLKKGDFLRIPGNALHWAWNRGSEPCTMAQVHAPVLNPDLRKGTLGLFADNETPQVRKSPPQETLDVDVSEVERRVFARVGSGRN